MARFFRVCNTDSQQGLWYDFSGKFTGLIHGKFDFCAVNELEMPFDEELVGWLSATPDLESLWNWFKPEEIMRLQKFGWCIHEYETDDFKFYDKFQHVVINQMNSRLIRKIIL